MAMVNHRSGPIDLALDVRPPMSVRLPELPQLPPLRPIRLPGAGRASLGQGGAAPTLQELPQLLRPPELQQLVCSSPETCSTPSFHSTDGAQLLARHLTTLACEHHSPVRLQILCESSQP